MHDLTIAIGHLGAALTPKLVLLSIASIFVAAVLRGFTGFGFALAAVPLLGLFMAPTEAVPVAIGLQLAGSLLDFRTASRSCDWPSLRWLMIGALIGSPLGTLILTEIPAAISRLIISSVTLLAVFALGRGFALPVIPPRPVTSIAGFFSGLFNGLAAMPGPPGDRLLYVGSAATPGNARVADGVLPDDLDHGNDHFRQRGLVERSHHRPVVARPAGDVARHADSAKSHSGAATTRCIARSRSSASARLPSSAPSRA